MFKHPFRVLALAVLIACASAVTSSGPALARPLAQGAPDGVVSSFLDAWRRSDYPSMYGLLSQQSQSTYSLAVFQQIYTDANTAIQITDLNFSITETRLQGSSAAVRYDLTLESPVFGSITDAGRIMRLVQNGGGWGIAWSSMDIFDGMTSGSRLEVISRRLPRGQILDKDGSPIVAALGTITPMYTSKNDMLSVEDCLYLTARVTRRQGYDLRRIFDLNNPETLFYLGIVDDEQIALYGPELQNTCGAGINDRFATDVRRYVLGGGAVHLTGYIGPIPSEQLNSYRAQGYADGDLVGLAGIEQQYEPDLSGQPEKVLQIISATGIPLRSIGSRVGVPPVDVTLTVDLELQRAASQALVEAFNYAEPNWAAQGIAAGAGVVVIDVNTGAIRAMSSYPFIDPYVYIPGVPIPDRGQIITDWVNDTERRPLSNHAVQEQFFPGSTFKIITLAAAINEGLMPEPTFFCDLEWDGRAQYGDTASPRSDWRVLEPPDSRFYQTPAGDVTAPQALAASCNPFFYEMGARLFTQTGGDTLTRYARQLGLGGPTGLQGYREAGGNLPETTSVEQGINEAIGQGGVQVSVLQMARMVAAIANGGTLYRPYVVERVGGQQAGQPLAVSEIGLLPTTLATVREGMCAAVANTDLGTAAGVFSGATYTACGKTGTAQSGRQAPYGWFVAYAPADNPQIAVAAVVEFSREGSETAAPIIRRILDAYFNQEPAPFPDWWNSGPYNPLPISANSTGG